MESPQPPDRPDHEQGAATPPPPPRGPQAPAGPQAPGAPPPGAPAAPGAPQAPAAPPPPPGPEGVPSYGGPVPPGGWQQPIAQRPGWSGQPLASWGSRVAATLIDWLILVVPVVVLTIIVVAIATGSDTAAWVTGALGFLAFLVVAFIYAPVLMMREGEHNGQTWGKQALGIRVVRDNGEPMSFGWAALREIAVKGLAVSIASSIIPLIPWLLDNLWPLWDDENRALHDMVCSTHVVRA
jgi:uncharacterized RDD family membrane protein YckC